ncbi:hypothetical protein COLO4_33067 [Corchorus olitorius]|uniref:Protein FAR1-RELATED SEQUENCE n=1 Tax=Corchorus olitorius TaxID=93759 RepID=A0A1R3GWQ5_9ROSI|nr:hypothetical protein COLO4_33067 [Corchorus olitorius]
MVVIMLSLTPGWPFSIEEAKHFYANFGKKKGFGIITRDSRKLNGTIDRFKLSCSREGSPRRSTDKLFRLRPTQKVNCPAGMWLSKVDIGYVVTKLVLEHSHDMVPTMMGCQFHCNKIISPSVKRRLQIIEQAGIPIAKNYNSVVVEAGGYDKMAFTQQDCKNYLFKERHLQLGTSDGVAVQEFLTESMRNDKDFIYLMDLDEESRICSIFWADARARAAYESFGDVVTFDTTYRTNKYGIPFAPFVGVNHHGSSILLGCGLLANEKVETFVWLFKSWLNCMQGVPPQAIITDQCSAMRKAIQIVFPGIHHRWCQHHITSKLGTKLGSHKEYKEIKQKFDKAVYDSLQREEFEELWGEMVSSHNLEDNKWLKKLFRERGMWGPAFVKDSFWAGMSTTTQPSEGVNALFDGFVTPCTSLTIFIQQYQAAVAKKAQKEVELDFRSASSTIECVSDFNVEMQFQSKYTHDMFKKVQEQMIRQLFRYPKLISNEGGKKRYEVQDKIKKHNYCRRVTYVVEFEKETSTITCGCLLFDFQGIYADMHSVFWQWKKWRKFIRDIFWIVGEKIFGASIHMSSDREKVVQQCMKEMRQKIDMLQQVTVPLRKTV